MTAFNPSAARRPEGNVPPIRTQAAGLAPVIIAAGHDAPVNVRDELRGHWLLRRLRAQPAVGCVGDRNCLWERVKSERAEHREPELLPVRAG